MKRKLRIHAETLSRNLPPPSETFAADTMARLRALAAKEEAPIMKRKVFQTILIAALLLALLAATALAISALNRSAKSEQLTTARQALMDTYGLTPETIGLFFYTEIPQPGGAVSYLFSDMGGDGLAEKAGFYTVVLSPDADPVATWSHDGVDPALWRDGSPDAPVWGQPQLAWFLADVNARNQKMGEMDWDGSTPEERAAVLPTIHLYDGKGGTLPFDRAVPGPEDLSPGEAQALAAQALSATYGIPGETLATFLSQVDLGAPQDGDGPRQYQVEYYNGSIPGSLIAQLDAATGAPLFTRWWTEPENRTLPEGPLDGYEQAVAEFLSEGALPLQPAAAKADIVNRIEAAGLSALLPFDTPAYAAPDPDDLPEAEAVVLGREALLAHIPGLTPELLDAFYAPPRTALVEDEEGRRWQLTYPCAPGFDIEYGRLADKLGEYFVALNAQDGTLEEVSWSLIDLADGKSYTRETLRHAPAYGPAELALLLAIRQDMDALIARYPTYAESWIYDFTLADVAEYHRLTREAGLPLMDERRIPAVPGPDHLPQEEALALAMQALQEDLGISQAALEAAHPAVEFILEDGRAQWEFFIVVLEDGIDQGCFVALDALTGEILTTDVTTGGNG